jgi:hypothetical protein
MSTATSSRSAEALNLRPRKEAAAKAKEKCDELKTTVYVMEAVELYEPKKGNK